MSAIFKQSSGNYLDVFVLDGLFFSTIIIIHAHEQLYIHPVIVFVLEVGSWYDGKDVLLQLGEQGSCHGTPSL